MPWFKRGDGHHVLVPAHMTDTLARLAREGWAEVTDPTVVALTPVAPTPPTPPTPAPTPSPDTAPTKGKR